MLTPIPGDRSCKNSYQFLRLLRDVHTAPDQNHCMVSFDITSLFTNVPITIACDLNRCHWDCIQPFSTLDLDAFIEGIQLCAAATIIQFLGKFYKQIFGCPMGSALSGALANLVMVDLENTALNQIPSSAICVYTRYVDDLFALMLRRFLSVSTSNTQFISSTLTIHCGKWSW